jgi:15-cis-phytoene synthase
MNSSGDLRLACKALMRKGSKSFFAASLLLPARVRYPSRALYAFCRVADDAIDNSADPAAQCLRLHARLDAIYAQNPGPDPADQALAALLRQQALPRTLFDALLEGFAWDAEHRRYESMADLHAYAARVAGTVGVMMTLLMETKDADALARACELGVAMQLTNIARDVGEDARAGRLYLPLQWLREEGVDPSAWLAKPLFDQGIARVIERLLAEADRLYAHGECGVRALPRDCRAAIQAARLIYADIGSVLRSKALDAISHRAVVGQPRKLWLLARASAAAVRAPGHPMDWVNERAPLPEVAFLVHAAASHELPARTFTQRVVRAVELFERQVQRQRGTAMQ